MRGAKYAIHHVGGRWGNGPFPLLKEFAGDFVHVLYDADTDAVETAKSAPRPDDIETIILSSCLAGHAGERTLNITLNPGGTSLLEPADALHGFYRAIFGIDFDLQGGLQVVGRRTVRGEPLDSVLAVSGCPPPDFLSLDTQGSEYEILCGSASALERICGLIVEVEFIEMYKGQKRFHEVHDLLDAHGFSFCRFEHLGELAGPRQPIGFRGRGRMIWADALFLRRPETASDTFQLAKLAFTSLVFGHIEFALACLDRLDLDQLDGAAPGMRYASFLREVAAAYQAADKIFPALFSQVLPRERATAFSTAAPERWFELFDMKDLATPGHRDALDRLSNENETAFETVLRRYGLDDVATQVAQTRMHQAVRTKAALFGES